MQKTALHILLGLCLGAITAVVGSIVQAGAWKLPWGGLVLAAAIVVAGTWFSYEIGALAASFAFALAMFSVTVVLFFFSPSNDVLALAEDYRAHAWILGSVVLSVVTMISVDVLCRRRSVQHRDDDATQVAEQTAATQAEGTQTEATHITAEQTVTEQVEAKHI
ncbi:FtsH-binding integral membrane protein [Arcanobacterium pluranimalium]|uniref:hypothetical protein n=1 Tax=Arcanobacterium pluranimalium TaxID=108028 RepID=UPI00195BF1E9|nr:hypothetical protein [Arcanobacterium pluranimalium]MBM7824857.1 FtsH-binding integral membrane protein [Arcanobacterium pluranimalium]